MVCPHTFPIGEKNLTNIYIYTYDDDDDEVGPGSWRVRVSYHTEE